MHKRPALVEAPGGFVPMPTSLKQVCARHDPLSRARVGRASSQRRSPAPPRLQAATNQLEYHCFMGIFPSIKRAWMTIDHILFLWDYTDPRGSFYQYDGLDQAIIHAALVTPRAGVFPPDASPHRLLLLSTPLEVVVLALYCTGGELNSPGRACTSAPAASPAYRPPHPCPLRDECHRRCGAACARRGRARDFGDRDPRDRFLGALRRRQHGEDRGHPRRPRLHERRRRFPLRVAVRHRARMVGFVPHVRQTQLRAEARPCILFRQIGGRRVRRPHHGAADR